MINGFSELKPYPSKLHIDTSARATNTYLVRGNARMLALMDRSLSRWSLPDRAWRAVDAMVGRAGLAPTNSLASNMRMRRSLAGWLRRTFEEERRAHPGRRYFLVTLIHDGWLTYDRDTYVWLGSMRKIVPPVMARGGFDGWYGTIEFQMLDETVRGLGRVIMGHAHVLAWTDDPSFRPLAAGEKMRNTQRLISKIGAPTVDVTPQLRSHPNPFVSYMNKIDDFGKCRAFDRSKPSGIRLDACVLPPVAAVRMVELLSCFELHELILAGGSGAGIGRGARTFIDGAVSSAYRRPHFTAEEAQIWWERTRAASCPSDTYAPISIDREGGRMPPAAMLSLEAPKLTRWLTASASPTL